LNGGCGMTGSPRIRRIGGGQDAVLRTHAGAGLSAGLAVAGIPASDELRARAV